MSFTVDSIDLIDFRNHERSSFRLSPDLTVLVGPNATGKTSVVEALQLTTAATSFRKVSSWDELVRHGAPRGKVILKAHEGPCERTVELSLERDGRRRYEVNTKNVRRVLDVTGVIPAVVFTPDDLGLVKESSSRRRGQLDELGTQLSRTYGSIVSDYERVVRQRNAALKAESADTQTLDALDVQMIDMGSRLAEHRLRLFERVRSHVQDLYGSLSEGETLSAKYQTAWMAPSESRASRESISVALSEAVRSARAEDLARRTSSVGPHRDDVRFEIEGAEARAFASQGQQRTVALAWKLAEVAVTEDILGSPPLLLLDDVMSELDDVRRAALTEAVDSSTQTVVTTTNLGYFTEELLQRATVVQL